MSPSPSDRTAAAGQGPARQDQPPRWQPPQLAAVHEGYATTGKDEALAEACDRLGVALVDRHRRDVSKAAHAKVALPDGRILFLKVTGLVGKAWNHHRQAEVESLALTGVPRPSILRSADWHDNGVFWHAVLMTLAPGAAVTATTWVETGSAAITDEWLGELRAGLNAMRLGMASHPLGTPEDVQGLIRTFIGDHAPSSTPRWEAAHGDLNWSNLTAPEFMMLDWESYCLAPAGYDAGRLLAFTVLDDGLTARLMRTLAEELHSPDSRVGVLAGIAMVKHQIREGQVTPALSAPVERLIHRVLAR